jgi:uncharacterized protein YqhQ
MEKPIVGGQAVIEGVMMRGFGKVATAVREPDGNINVQVKPVSSIMESFPILKLPFQLSDFLFCREQFQGGFLWKNR